MLKIIFITLFGLSGVYAGEFGPADIPTLAKQYRFLSSLAHFNRDDLNSNCECQGPEACMIAACTNMSTFECDDADELKKMAHACQGNHGDGCYYQFISYLDKWQHDSLEESVKIAQACRGNHGGGCIKFICSRLSEWDCDSFEELNSIALACGGN